MKLTAQVERKNCSKTGLDFVQIALFMNGGIQFVVCAMTFKEAVKRMKSTAKKFAIVDISTVEYV